MLRCTHDVVTVSLPLMRKTFIEAWMEAALSPHVKRSLPLMRKTFIEARLPTRRKHAVTLVSSAYAEDFH